MTYSAKEIDIFLIGVVIDDTKKLFSTKKIDKINQNWSKLMINQTKDTRKKKKKKRKSVIFRIALSVATYTRIANARQLNSKWSPN